ncbi:MAG: hypothetical protein ACTS2F_27590 [Thainema sp.]
MEEKRERDPQATDQDRPYQPTQLPTPEEVAAYLRWLGYPEERYRRLDAANRQNSDVLALLWAKNVRPRLKKGAF